MSKPKTGLESLGSQIAYRSKTLLLRNFKWREIIHCKTDRVCDMDLVKETSLTLKSHALLHQLHV